MVVSPDLFLLHSDAKFVLGGRFQPVPGAIVGNPVKASEVDVGFHLVTDGRKCVEGYV